MAYSPNNNKVSTLNGTTTLLNAGATYTGTWEDVSNYDSLIISLKTDQNGTFTVQFSPDGTNADTTLTRYYRTDQIEAPHNFTNTKRYARVTFTNTSASNQTYLRLQVLLGNHKQLNIPLDSMIAQDYDSISVRPTKFEYEVALGRRQGSTTWNKFGYNTDVDTAATEVIASFGGTFTPLTTASTLTIVSSSASDDGSPSGVGANTLVIYGVDANRQYQTETITMNGTTNVVTAATWLGVNRVAIGLSGSSLVNVGNINITATTGGSTQAYLLAGEGVTQQAIFFTQKDHQFLTDFLRINVEKLAGGATPKCRIKGWVYSAVTNTKFSVYNELIDTSSDNFVSVNPSQPFAIPEQSCLWFEATTDTNDTFVSCRFSGIEFKDVDA